MELSKNWAKFYTSYGTGYRLWLSPDIRISIYPRLDYNFVRSFDERVDAKPDYFSIEIDSDITDTHCLASSWHKTSRAARLYAQRLIESFKKVEL